MALCFSVVFVAALAGTLFVFLVINLFHVATGETALESKIRSGLDRQLIRRQQQYKGQHAFFPYDNGTAENFREFIGNRPAFWLLPQPVHNGPQAAARYIREHSRYLQIWPPSWYVAAEDLEVV